MNRYTVNPDEIYDRYLTAETADDFLERVRSKDICRYTIQRIFSGDWVEVKIFPEWKKRAWVPRRGETSPDAKQRQNKKDAINKLTRILNHNFVPYKDYFLTMTFDDDHLVLDDDTGFEMAEKGIRRIKYQYKKAGVELRAVYKIEIKRAKRSDSSYIRTADGRQLYRPHLHIVLNGGVDWQKIEQAWAVGENKKLEMLRWSNVGFLKLAQYLCKDTKKGRRRWNSTANLIKPPPPRTTYSDKQGRKSRVFEIAKNENLHKAYFEQLLPEYSFIQSTSTFSDFGSGCYIHARMAKR
ncbi:MAG: hypothetical protein E7488_05840 [Ruminococcaceae bacterium]|nr:hypothetical protein [Oscillospiraceae bacterium]